ncbi:MAG: hypothetical protein AAFW75_06080 [Cyanobacteria bacterium J06636_16]
MNKLQPLFASTAIALNVFIVAPAFANCLETLPSTDYLEPAMARHWQQLQDETTYPWGTARPYGELTGDHIVMTPAFDALTGPQKNQVLDLLNIENAPALRDLLTPEERIPREESGLYPPYTVAAHDDRMLYRAYNACRPMRLLTERDRYSYYFFSRFPRHPETDEAASYEDLRNAGQPFWRDVQFPLAVADERSLRLSFWEAVGYDKANQGWWIAWVPEQGHFEIVVSEDYSPADLQRFWQVASDEYSYVVMTTGGTPILER